VPVSRTIPEEYRVSLSAFHIRFAETHVASGVPPVLPNGAKGLTDEEAVTAAMSRFGLAVGSPLPSDIGVAARFGLFSDDVMAVGGPGRPMQLLYQDRPAWIVTFYGDGVRMAARGPAGQLVDHHERNFVIDAATGTYLMSFH
jgi:hypothetical protein